MDVLDVDLDVADGSEKENPKPKRKTSKDVPPQQSIDAFWKRFTTKNPGKPFTILPDNLYAKRAAIRAARQPARSKNAVASYEQAASSCRAKVEKIVQECRKLNQKYKDPYFDIEFDFYQKQWSGDGYVEDCLATLDADEARLRPMSVKRIEDIFDDPQFYIEGMSASDVRQGRDGDCWFMSSICTLCNKEDLLEKVCVARDEKVGVYGFVFHRDGEWISEVIDDKLYLAKEDFHESLWERYDWLVIDMPNPDDEYRKVMQTGSKALYFAQCKDQNETWLPLLEKAYAKAHGDYASIEGGWVGEGLEDLTGGVTSELFAADILDKDKFWYNDLMNVNKNFLFGLAQMGGKYGERRGIIEKHAYSIMEAQELDNFRLLKIRNPWGKKEWDGPWSDGSEEWTPDRMRRLNHQFGNDGAFWISYKDLLKHFQHIDRTRLFGPGWSVTQKWTSVNVPWSVNYLDTHFKFSLPKAGPTVIVLAQLDDRYFRGLTDQYYFKLQFRLHKEGEDDYLTRNNPFYFMDRSATAELELEAGSYSVFIKITASRDKFLPTAEAIIRKTCQTRRDKLMAVGLSYDLAHAKGNFKESEHEQKEQQRKKRQDKRKKQAKEAFEANRRENKKEKLRKRRLAAKKALPPSGDDDDVIITVKVGQDTLTLNRPHGASEIAKGTKFYEQTVSGKAFKLVLEANEESGLAKGSEQATDEKQSAEEKIEVKQGGDTDQKIAETQIEGKKEKADDVQAELKDAATEEGGQKIQQTSSPSGSAVTPASSENNSSGDAGDGGKAEDQSSLAKQDDIATVNNDGLGVSTKGEKAPDIDETGAKSGDVKLGDEKTSGTAEKSASEAGEIIDTVKEQDEPTSIKKLTLDDISDDDLSWSSDIDAPSDSSSCSSSDEESDPDFDASPSSDPFPDDKSKDDIADDPWNAVCVVGLRVYAKGSEAEIKVIKGKGMEARSSPGKQGQGMVEAAGAKKLDVDDRAADETKKLGKEAMGKTKEGEGPR